MPLARICTALEAASRTTMDQTIAQLENLNQKDKAPAYLSLLSDILKRDQSSIAADLHTLVNTVVNNESVGLVVSRQVLSELVKGLGEGIVQDSDIRKQIVEDTLSIVSPRLNAYEEQVHIMPVTLI
jgi:COP9 signalosome complex subunit 4